MAAITSIDAGQVGAFNAAEATLSADDTITFKAAKKQLLVLRNPTGGSITATIDGDGGSTVTLPGVGVVDVSAGKAIAVAAGASVAVVLGTINAYCKGVVHITGGTGLKIQLFDI